MESSLARQRRWPRHFCDLISLAAAFLCRRRFAEAIAGHRQIRAITAGHVHRAAAAQWHGHTAIICPSTAAAVALDLAPIDPAHPDNRVLITDEPPGFALHQWNGTQLTSHILTTSDARPLARFNSGPQAMIVGMFEERPGV